ARAEDLQSEQEEGDGGEGDHEDRMPADLAVHAAQVRAQRGVDAGGVLRLTLRGGHQRTSRQARERSFQPLRSFTTVSRSSCQTTRSCTGSLTTAPTRPEATSLARRVPSPKWAARARPELTTEIASAVLRVPEGLLSLFFPSAVLPSRSSRKMVT